MLGELGLAPWLAGLMLTGRQTVVGSVRHSSVSTLPRQVTVGGVYWCASIVNAQVSLLHSPVAITVNGCEPSVSIYSTASPVAAS